jgi:hypothetical protein
MPRVNHVKHARALYHTKPDIDPETGEQKVALVFRRDGVTPKTDKRGRQIERRLTVRDLDRPKPNLRCDFPGCDIDGGEILPGTSYKFIDLRFGKRCRHAEHPNWKHWEYSSSVAAQAARLQADMHDLIDAWEPTEEDDLQDMATELQGRAEDFLSEREEARDNMPEQLQDGSLAAEQADAAQEWVDAFDNVEEPSAEFAASCEECDGTGEVENPDYDPDVENPLNGEDEETIDCEACDGGSTEDPSEDWVEEARDALRALVDEAAF